MSDKYLIRFNGGWYRPDANGYTDSVFVAGRFSRGDALKHGEREGTQIISADPDSLRGYMSEGERAAHDRIQSLEARAEAANILAAITDEMGVPAKDLPAWVSKVYGMKVAAEAALREALAMAVQAQILLNHNNARRSAVSAVLTRMWNYLDAIAGHAPVPTDHISQPGKMVSEREKQLEEALQAADDLVDVLQFPDSATELLECLRQRVCLLRHERRDNESIKAADNAMNAFSELSGAIFSCGIGAREKAVKNYVAARAALAGTTEDASDGNS